MKKKITCKKKKIKNTTFKLFSLFFSISLSLFSSLFATAFLFSFFWRLPTALFFALQKKWPNPLLEEKMFFYNTSLRVEVLWRDLLFISHRLKLNHVEVWLWCEWSLASGSLSRLLLRGESKNQRKRAGKRKKAFTRRPSRAGQASK